MKSNLPKKFSKMLWDYSEAARDMAVQNVVISAKKNEIKLSHEDLQKLSYIISSTIDQVCMDASRNFENRISELVSEELSSKSSSKK